MQLLRNSGMLLQQLNRQHNQIAEVGISRFAEPLLIRTVDYSKLRRGVDHRKLRTIGQKAIIFRAGDFPYKALRLLLI